MALTASETIDAVKWLEQDGFNAGLRDKNQNTYRAIRQLVDVPNLSSEVTRGDVVSTPSPFISDLTSAVISQVAGYSTYPSATAMADALTPTEADRIEQMIALLLAEANEGMALLNPLYDDLLNRSHAVIQLVCQPAGARSPFRVKMPQADTVYFHQPDDTYRPPIVGRKYKMLVREAETTFSSAKGGQLAFDDKTNHLHLEELSAERRTDSPSAFVSKAPMALECTVYEYHDRDYSYTTIKIDGTQQKPGNEVRLEPVKCMTYGPPFICVPGNPQRDNDPAMDWRPIFWPAYTLTRQINRGMTNRVTRSERIMPHLFALIQQQVDDDTFQKTFAPLATDAGITLGPTLTNIRADKLEMWNPTIDPDIREQIAELRAERDQYRASWLFPVTPQTVSQANVGTSQIAWQVVHQRESELIGPSTRALAELARMMVNALGQYKDAYTFNARSQVEYGQGGKIEAGTAVSVTPELLKKVKVYGPDYNLAISVTTRSETEAELEQREAAVWANVQRNMATGDDYIAVRHTNVTTYREALAEDSVRKSLAPQWDTVIPTVAADMALEDLGYRLPIGGPGTAPAPGGAPQGQRGQAMPQVEGATVSSTGGAM